LDRLELLGVGRFRHLGNLIVQRRPLDAGATTCTVTLTFGPTGCTGNRDVIAPELHALVSGLAPDLLGECGVGAVCAAIP
jgi:hypothetical protein